MMLANVSLSNERLYWMRVRNLLRSSHGCCRPLRFSDDVFNKNFLFAILEALLCLSMSCAWIYNIEFYPSDYI